MNYQIHVQIKYIQHHRGTEGSGLDQPQHAQTYISTRSQISNIEPFFKVSSRHRFLFMDETFLNSLLQFTTTPHIDLVQYLQSIPAAIYYHIGHGSTYIWHIYLSWDRLKILSDLGCDPTYEGHWWQFRNIFSSLQKFKSWVM